MDFAWRITGLVFLALLFFMIIKVLYPVFMAASGFLIAVFDHFAGVLSML